MAESLTVPVLQFVAAGLFALAALNAVYDPNASGSRAVAWTSLAMFSLINGLRQLRKIRGQPR